MYVPIIAHGYRQGRWQEITEQLNQPILTLQGQYQELRVLFRHQVVETEKEYRGSFPLSDLEAVKLEDTFLSWSERRGNLAIEGWDEITDWENGKQSVHLVPVSEAGIQVLAGNKKTHPENITDRLEIYPDLQLYKPNFNQWDAMVDNCLAVVNGLLCPIKNYGDYGLVEGGKRIVDADESVTVDLCSFNALGGIDVLPLVDYVELNDINLTRKDVTITLEDIGEEERLLLVLGGRLFCAEELLRWVDTNRLRIKLANLDLMSLIAEDFRRLNFATANPWWGGELNTVSGLNKLLTCSQSFLIKFKKPVRLYVERKPLERSGLANTYLMPVLDTGLLVRADNRGVAHWITHNGNPDVPHVVKTLNAGTPRFWEHTGVDTDNTLLTGVKTIDIEHRSEVVFKLDLYHL